MSRVYEALRKVERLDDERPSAAPGGRPAPPRNGHGDQARGLQYDQLRVWIANQSHNGSGVRVVMVAACRPGSGTTTTVAGLGAALSDQPSARVLVVDANFRTPHLDRVYGCPNAHGLSELLAQPAGEAERLVQPSGRANLFVLPSGRPPGNPVGIFERGALERLMAELRARFDVVLLDAPPLLDFPEGYSLARHVDALLLVLDAERTSLDDARRTTRELERAGARAAGIVLNRQRDYVPRLLRRVLGQTT
jgi:capsular exopolysaccharide synthesis family protein